MLLGNCQKEATDFEERMTTEQSEQAGNPNAFQLKVELQSTPKHNYELVNDSKVQTILIDASWSLEKVLQVESLKIGRFLLSFLPC